MTVAELITLLQGVGDDNKEIVIKTNEPCDIYDIEEREGHTEIIPGATIDTDCKKCDGEGYFNLEEHFIINQ